MLPGASAPGVATRYVDALFTSTSAVCVTGLITVLTATNWTIAGKVIIIVLIQIGGLGILTASALFALAVGKKFSLRERLLMQEALGRFSIAGLVRLTRHILLLTFGIESIGALLLTIRWSLDMPLPKAAWFGVFHSISAFCNAGFDLFGNSLEGYVQDWPVNLIMTSLIIIGGIGFVVILDLFEARARWHKLSVHTKIVLVTTVVLLVGGTMTIFALEYSNPDTLAPLSTGGKWLASYFHAVTPRTAGFNTLSTGKMTPAALFLTMVLMFIGASPGGTGGGIKTTTFSILVIATVALTRGREPSVDRKSLGQDLINRALSISLLSLGLLVSVTFLLTITEKQSFLALLFEAASAFGTVGLTTGITPHLSDPGKLGLILLMFAGRLGPLTLAMALAQQPSRAKLHYPEAKVMVG